MTVAPMMPTATYSDSEPPRCGTRPLSEPCTDGPIFSVSYRKPRKMIPSSAVIASSKRRKPCVCKPRMAKAMKPVITPAHSSGTPNSRFSPSAAPTNSATSVDIAMTSACSHMTRLAERG